MSLPFESIAKFRSGARPYRNTGYTMSVQPAMPVALPNQWSLILRGVVSLTFAPKNAPVWREENGSGDFRAQKREFGLGNLNVTGWLVRLGIPMLSGKFYVGMGPTMSAPSVMRRDERLNMHERTAGPYVIGIHASPDWLLALRAGSQWPFAGPRGRPRYNQLEGRYFIIRFLKGDGICTRPPM